VSARPRIALVGAGSMGAHHARALAQSERCDLALVVDPDEATGRRAAALQDAAWAPELVVDGVDAVVLAAPTEQHHALALHVLDAGLPLLVEKPVCGSLSETEEVLERAAARGVPLQCGLLERFNPAVLTVVAMVRAPLWVRAERHSAYVPRIRTGVAWDLLVHDVDLAVQIYGGSEPEAVASRLGHFHPQSEPGAEDVAEALLGFGGGRAASISASRVGQRKVRTLEIHELDRVLEVDLLRRTVTAYRQTSVEFVDGGLRQQTVMEVPEIHGREPLLSQLDHFLDLVNGRVDADVERASILPVHRIVSRVAHAGQEGAERRRA
jgi:predicted dehydrogenase